MQLNQVNNIREMETLDNRIKLDILKLENVLKSVSKSRNMRLHIFIQIVDKIKIS